MSQDPADEAAEASIPSERLARWRGGREATRRSRRRTLAAAIVGLVATKKRKGELGGRREGAGRKPRAGVAAAVNVTIRTTVEERERIAAAAEAAGMTISEWIRAAAAAMLARG